MMNSSESWFNCLSENDVQHIWNETKEGVATALDYIEIADGLFLEEDLELFAKSILRILTTGLNYKKETGQTFEEMFYYKSEDLCTVDIQYLEMCFGNEKISFQALKNHFVSLLGEVEFSPSDALRGMSDACQFSIYLPRGYHIRPATAEWHSLLIRNIKDSTKRFLATFEAVYAVHNEKSEEEKQDLRQSIIRRDQTIVNGVQLPPDFKHEFFVPGWNLYVYPPNAEPENV
uniref:Ring_hydroxyl_A domain-containing protein n=1 Tax=Caenorhabditis tropicalis TaxID=1561998 RepID=A0A1I7TN39_9PELO